MLLHSDRLRQAGAGNAQRKERKVAFIQARHKLAAKPGTEQAAQDHCNGHARENDRLVAHSALQQRRISILHFAHQRIFRFGDLIVDQQRHRCRDEGDRQDHGADQGDHNRKRHRMKHLSFDPGQHEDRQIDNHDDQLAV